jgi:two-component system response regulator HupR/HoxA
MAESKQHVLIVDDEPLNRDLLRRVLQATYVLSEAGDASEALAVLEGEDGAGVQLILCDHLMPGKTGAELAVIVRERWPSIAFMLITGYDGDDEVLRAEAEGIVDRVLSKPWRSTELRAAIAQGLEA